MNFISLDVNGSFGLALPIQNARNLPFSTQSVRLGLSVDVILSKYDFIDLSKLTNLSIETPYFKCLEYANTMWSATAEGCNLHLLDARHPAGYFHRGKIYGCEDDIARFIYFSRAA